MTAPAPAVNQTTPDLVIPYITRDQYRCAPTAIETSNLIRNGSQADQDAELDRLIRQATSWCDKAAEQPLTAQVTTQTLRARVGADGKLRLHPRQHPVVQVNGVQFGYDATSMSTLSDLSGVWVEDQSVEIPLQSNLAGGFTGPLQFNSARPGTRLKVALTYVAGWAVTTLAGAALATDSTLSVKNTTGMVPGTQLRVEQGASGTSLAQTTVVVQSVTGNTVTLTAPVGVAFNAGAAVSAMPDEVEQACIYAVTAHIKQRGSSALVMGGRNAGTVAKGDGEEPGAMEFDLAEATLSLYRPVAP